MTRLMIAWDEKWMSMGISTSEWIESVDSSRVWKRLPNLVLHHHFPIIFPSFCHNFPIICPFYHHESFKTAINLG
jgi:hypothetical protein